MLNLYTLYNDFTFTTQNEHKKGCLLTETALQNFKFYSSEDLGPKPYFFK